MGNDENCEINKLIKRNYTLPLSEVLTHFTLRGVDFYKNPWKHLNGFKINLKKRLNKKFNNFFFNSKPLKIFPRHHHHQQQKKRDWKIVGYFKKEYSPNILLAGRSSYTDLIIACCWIFRFICFHTLLLMALVRVHTSILVNLLRVWVLLW